MTTIRDIQKFIERYQKMTPEQQKDRAYIFDIKIVEFDVVLEIAKECYPEPIHLTSRLNAYRGTNEAE